MGFDGPLERHQDNASANTTTNADAGDGRWALWQQHRQGIDNRPAPILTNFNISVVAEKKRSGRKKRSFRQA